MRLIKNLALGSLLLLGASVLSSCGSSSKALTREGAYPNMYTAGPKSILLMPPINETNQVDSKENLYATLMQPLADRGYYVFSPFLSQELLRQEGADNSEEFIEQSLTPFASVFGADAALFTVIHEWKKNALSAKIIFDIEYQLRSVKTGEMLFQKRVAGDINTSAGNIGGGIFTSLVQMAADALSTALTDKVVAARIANLRSLSDMPVGPLHPLHRQDQKIVAGAPVEKNLHYTR